MLRSRSPLARWPFVLCGFAGLGATVVTVAPPGGGNEPAGPEPVGPLRRTAILVSDVERSLRFYRDLLGLEVFYDPNGVLVELTQLGPLRRRDQGGTR